MRETSGERYAVYLAFFLGLVGVAIGLWGAWGTNDHRGWLFWIGLALILVGTAIRFAVLVRIRRRGIRSPDHSGD